MPHKLTWWVTIGWWLVAVAFGWYGGASSVPSIRGQAAQPKEQPAPPRTLPPALQQAAFDTPPVSSAITQPALDVTNLPPVAQEVYRGARSGTEWLCRVHQ